MTATDDALKNLTETLQDAVKAINSLLDDEKADHAALDAANEKIAQLQNTEASKDSTTAEAINSLTSSLQDLAKKAMTAVPSPSSDPENSNTQPVPTAEIPVSSDQPPVNPPVQQAFNV